MFIDFSNKNVLITGGSRGIGRACAQLFSELQANVIITYKSDKREAERTLDLLEASGKNRAYQLDISIPEKIDSLFKNIISE
jgi:NAD(P)-dependent dehydrogenase (short-subunit alcohol dehydrogenase family)